MSKITYMDMGEFREAGYLQEANRKFFHPLGLALEMQWNESDGTAAITGVWDYRHDPEGIVFVNETDEERAEFAAKAQNVKGIWHERKPARVGALRFMIQPYGEIHEEVGSDVVGIFAQAIRDELNSVLPVKAASSESWQKAARGVLDKVSHKFSEEGYEPTAVTPEEVHVMDLVMGNPTAKQSRVEALNMIIDDRNAYREMLQTATAALAAIRDGKASANPETIADIALSDIGAEMGG